ncbi:alpha/beta fold hydrolase [Roseateles violae]|uniref:Alpha/beta hydrolase n=1 Tax=Roseateles violae TaxID=3058042 RepID=A0ABT8DLW8_9BURK|nr:alpha/beta hydrolase [Pelomonas sp. PFR6]MDN3919390.1 alpha/beta hydrolase [Pelomonas sp. PFR6]
MNASPLIALPGTLLDGRSLTEALAGLQPRTLILGEAASLDEEVDRLAAQAPVPAIWVGHSLGGIVALHLARRHPASVAALVLLGTNARAGYTTNETRRAAQWAVAQEEGLDTLVRKELAPSYGLAERGIEDALLTSLVEQAEAVGLQRFAHQLGYARQRPGLMEPPQHLSCPALVLSGELDALCPPVQSDEILALMQPPGHAAHHMLDGVGHLFPMQQAGRVAEHLRRFLSSIEESVI